MKKFNENRFDLIECTKEFSDKKEIKTGCTVYDAEPHVLYTFKNKIDALAALKKKESIIQEITSVAGTKYFVFEYAVECYEVNEDGEYKDGSRFHIADFSDYSKRLLRQRSSV